jgi:hypothetical protein
MIGIHATSLVSVKNKNKEQKSKDILKLIIRMFSRLRKNVPFLFIFVSLASPVLFSFFSVVGSLFNILLLRVSA